MKSVCDFYECPLRFNVEEVLGLLVLTSSYPA